MIDADTNTFCGQNKWRIILWQEWFKALSLDMYCTDSPQLLNRNDVDYQCSFHDN